MLSTPHADYRAGQPPCLVQACATGLTGGTDRPWGQRAALPHSTTPHGRGSPAQWSAGPPAQSQLQWGPGQGCSLRAWQQRTEPYVSLTSIALSTMHAHSARQSRLHAGADLHGVHNRCPPQTWWWCRLQGKVQMLCVRRGCADQVATPCERPLQPDTVQVAPACLPTCCVARVSSNLPKELQVGGHALELQAMCRGAGVLVECAWPSRAELTSAPSWIMPRLSLANTCSMPAVNMPCPPAPHPAPPAAWRWQRAGPRGRAPSAWPAGSRRRLQTRVRLPPHG